MEGTWQCPACTLVNALDNVKCEVCTEPRPTDMGPAPVRNHPVLSLNTSTTVEQPKKQEFGEQAGSSADITTTATATATFATRSTVGLTEQERRARQDEMDAKRQKKDEEKRRILEQAEADRLSRTRDAAPSITQTASPTVVKPRELPSHVKLQLRCAQWNRNVVFTCFSPDSTLEEVRQCFREELVSGEMGTGDGRVSAGMSRVPPEEAMTLIESVPPRRRFATTEEMQTTLRAAGLCPASVLLVEAPPVQIDAQETGGGVSDEGEPSGMPSPLPVQDGAPGPGDGSDGEVHIDDPVSEPSLSDDDQPGDDDPDPGFNLGIPGGGLNRGRPHFGGGGRFGRGRGTPQRPQAPAGPRIGAGGQILGSSPAVSAPLDEQAARAARAARLAALERRCAGAAQEAPPTGVEPQPAVQDVPIAAPVGVVDLKIESEDKHPEGAGQAPEQFEPSRDAKTAVGAPQNKSTLMGRVPGQMGVGGPNKAERQRERENILQKMEEDRQVYDIRHTTPTTAVTPAQPKVGSGTVRLQLRCASSGRAVTTTAYDASSLLSSVCEFAAQEFGLSGSLPQLALTFPPRTVFDSPENLSSSLGELGLCPSATLLVKPAPAVYLAEAEEQVTRADLAPESQLAGADLAAESTDPAGSRGSALIRCPRGHIFTPLHMADEGWCDKCQAALPEGSDGFVCEACDFYLCPSCVRA